MASADHPAAAPLKALIVAHSHPELTAGGAETAAYDLFRALRGTPGVSAHFLAATRDAALLPVGEPLASYAGRADEWLALCDARDDFRFAQLGKPTLEAFARLIKRLDPDVVHFHHYLNVGLEFLTLARRVKRSLRIVLTLHDYLAICHHNGVLAKTYAQQLCLDADPEACAACFRDIPAADFAARRQRLKAVFDSIDALVAPSRFLRDRYVAWGVPAWQVEVLENALTLPRPVTPRRDGEARARFAFFGQIHPYKGLLTLLSAFAAIRRRAAERGPRPSLVIHGAYLELNDPAFIDSFRRLLDEAGPLVRVAGRYARADLPQLLEEIDWVVMPSIWWENAPLVIEEALACHRPVLCSGIGGMAEKVRDGKDGFHFRAGDPEALADLVARVAADQSVWEGLQRSMRKPTDLDETVAQHLALYRERSFGFA